MTDQISLLDIDELNAVVDLGEYPRFGISVELGLKTIAFGKDAYFRNASMISKLSYLTENQWQMENY